MKNLREFIAALRARGEVQDIDVQVDPHLELAEIHRRVIENNGKVLFFKNVKGSPFPVVTNLFGNVSRIELAFGNRPEKFVQRAADLVHHALPPKLSTFWNARDLAFDALKIGLKTKRNGPVFEVESPLIQGRGLDELPALVQWPEDGGRFVTLPLVYTQHPQSGKHNLGMYRIHIYDEKTTGMHWQIHKGGGFHYAAAQAKNESLPVNLLIGGPPALILSAIAPLPEDIPELMLCSLLMGEKVNMTRKDDLAYPIVSEAEFAIVGEVPAHERRTEGPFGDHYGYYSLAHPYPVFNVKRMFHRKDAIYPATVVGKPRQEDFYIGDYLQKLLSPLFPIVMPSVLELKTYGETGFHALAAARVKDRYEREAIASGLRILGEGQLSLQKFLMLTDGNVNLDNFRETLVYFLERTNWDKDLFVISNVSQDTLDYSGPKVNEGSKGIWLALGPSRRALNGNPPPELPSGVRDAKVFVQGCLVISGPAFSDSPDFVSEICRHQGFAGYELVLVVDDVREATASEEKFLWTWFTRFEPAADIHAAKMSHRRFHTSLEAPVFFDSRMKPWYPKTVEPHEDTVKLVDRRWNEYFR
ncbi:MAG: UbiD family decarboxylase [Proteobacteria bacterium]|nr:UbiD family decarboxylase [Pseudomonadota bacterium]